MAACRAGLAKHGYTDVDVIEVPGAFEIPLRIKRLASSGQYAGLAAARLVIDGGIYRHEFVAATVVEALMRVQLDTDVPVFSAVLTPHHFHEHEEHRAYFARHFEVKGAAGRRDRGHAEPEGRSRLIQAEPDHGGTVRRAALCLPA